MITSNSMPSTKSHSTPAPGGTSQTDSRCRVVFSLTPANASTSTPLRGPENLPTCIPNAEARVTITYPLRMRATERNQRQRQWQLQPQAVSTPRSVVSSSRSIHRFVHSYLTRLVCATGRLMEFYMRNRWPFMSASAWETVSYATRPAGKSFAEATYWQIIDKYWNTAMQQNNIWSIAFEAYTKEILQEIR